MSFKITAFFILSVSFFATIMPSAAFSFPNVCTVMNTPPFRSCLGLKISNAMCGWPVPRPCARVTYWMPESFIEVVANKKETYFSDMPGAAAQLATTSGGAPFGFEDSDGAYSYQAHTLSVPFVSIPYASMTCGNLPVDRFCYSAMSEHLGSHWKTGAGDKHQPKFLAWQASPKACLLKGAAESFSPASVDFGRANTNLCSFDRSWLPVFPPSKQPVCSGWGFHFPRSGVVTSSDATTASLAIALRIKTLGAEVFQSVPSSKEEKWQMIYPQNSSCFKEGQNITALRMKSLNERGRVNLKQRKNYLYVIWKKVSCKRDWAVVPAVYAGVEVAKLACKGIE